MKYHIPMIIVFILLTISTLEGQNTPVEKGLEAITGDAIRAQLGFLSSDWMEGREAGEKVNSLLPTISPVCFNFTA
ncbi:MAG: hypothetical protein IPN67_08700 [Bacteroidales bacterium]|nr:hypothetical protein [Bacteroidales bacterium]